MTRLGNNVSAPESAEQGWQGPYLLVAGGDGAHAGWPAAENAVPSGRAELFRAGALAEKIEVFKQQVRRSSLSVEHVFNSTGTNASVVSVRRSEFVLPLIAEHKLGRRNWLHDQLKKELPEIDKIVKKLL